MYLTEEELKATLAGKVINKIYISEENLLFETDKGNVGFTVTGECCSHSYFHDFEGVESLLGKEVIDFKEVSLGSFDEAEYNEIKCYGYRITYIGDYGEQTAVFSFRNSSNGYYGGSMDLNEKLTVEGLKEITTNWITD